MTYQIFRYKLTNGEKKSTKGVIKTMTPSNSNNTQKGDSKNDEQTSIN